ncbi:MAG: HisA/HisF-related TIM barrel protein [Methylomonas sp.]|jgi:phosphoribosylformimino-5-aminoimidazole carboxamide ribotide isomerase
MQIIPVIDLKDGQVVHAMHGDRSLYQPIRQHSILTAGNDIDSVLNGFLKLFPFQTFYIADLNAISGAGHHAGLIESVLKAYPERSFWVDNGCQLNALPTQYPNNYKPVIGTESQLSPPHPVSRPFILSLDYRRQALGLEEWFTATHFWPQEVIVMTLSRVGSRLGPDVDKLAALKKSCPEKNFIAAGGVRHPADLSSLLELGMAGVLAATALHSGTLSVTELWSFSSLLSNK